MEGFTSKSIHTKFLKKDAHGSLHMPVYDCVSFEFESSEAIVDAFEGKKAAHAYTRITNPTMEHFEQKIRAVTGAQAVLALSSGMAAISNLIMTLCGSGDHIICSTYLFGNTKSLLDVTLKKWGLEVSFVDLEDLDAVKAAVTDKTRMIFGETIANPQMRVIDIPNLSKIAKENDIPLVIDSTVTPPYLFDGKVHGADIEVISSTKYISGGATSVGGLIIDHGTFAWKKNIHLADLAKKVGPFALIANLRKEVYRNLGACISPHNANLQSLGLDTLALRADKSCKNTLELAKFLEGNDKIKKVNYPGLTSSPYHEISDVLFPNLPGSILTFDCESKEASFVLMNKLQMIRRSTNLNDNKTLIIHPSSTIFAEFSEEEKLEMEVTPTLLRLSVGIEDIEDIKNDLLQGLE
ncbi:MAG: O-acetylhomoserine sulfhydrylase [Planctomycetota bacterium]|nr:MAG: O-acetylhomoserine sulfhydrylase [Planctomycetota bacterium]